MSTTPFPLSSVKVKAIIDGLFPVDTNALTGELLWSVNELIRTTSAIIYCPAGIPPNTV